MEVTALRYQVATWHGENASLHYIIDTFRDEIIDTFHTYAAAEDYCQHQNTLLISTT